MSDALVVQLHTTEDAQYSGTFIHLVHKLFTDKGSFVFRNSKARGRPPTKESQLTFLSTLERVYKQHNPDYKRTYQDNHDMRVFAHELEQAIRAAGEDSDEVDNSNEQQQTPSKLFGAEPRPKQNVVYTLDVQALLDVCTQARNFKSFCELVAKDSVCRTFAVQRDVVSANAAEAVADNQQQKPEVPARVQRYYPAFWREVNLEELHDFRGGVEAALATLDDCLSKDALFACLNRPFGLETISFEAAQRAFIEHELSATLAPLFEAVSQYEEQRRVAADVFQSARKEVLKPNKTLSDGSSWSSNNKKRRKVENLGMRRSKSMSSYQNASATDNDLSAPTDFFHSSSSRQQQRQQQQQQKSICEETALNVDLLTKPCDDDDEPTDRSQSAPPPSSCGSVTVDDRRALRRSQSDTDQRVQNNDDEDDCVAKMRTSLGLSGTIERKYSVHDLKLEAAVRDREEMRVLRMEQLRAEQQDIRERELREIEKRRERMEREIIQRSRNIALKKQSSSSSEVSGTNEVPDLHTLFRYAKRMSRLPTYLFNMQQHGDDEFRSPVDMWSSKTRQFRVDISRFIRSEELYEALRVANALAQEVFTPVLRNAVECSQYVRRAFEQQGVQTLFTQTKDSSSSSSSTNDDEDESEEMHMLLFADYNQSGSVFCVSMASFQWLVDNNYMSCLPVYEVRALSGGDHDDDDDEKSPRALRYVAGPGCNHDECMGGDGDDDEPNSCTFSAINARGCNICVEHKEEFLAVQPTQYASLRRRIASLFETLVQPAAAHTNEQCIRIDSTDGVPEGIAQTVAQHAASMQESNVYGRMLNWYEHFAARWFEYCHHVLVNGGGGSEGQLNQEQLQRALSKCFDGFKQCVSALCEQDALVDLFVDQYATSHGTVFIDDPCIDMNVAEYAPLLQHWQQNTERYAVFRPQQSWREWNERCEEVLAKVSAAMPCVVFFRYDSIPLQWVEWTLVRVRQKFQRAAVVCIGSLYARADNAIQRCELAPFIVPSACTRENQALAPGQFAVLRVQRSVYSSPSGGDTAHRSLPLSLGVESQVHSELHGLVPAQEDASMPQLSRFFEQLVDYFQQCCAENDEHRANLGMALFNFPLTGWLFEPLFDGDTRAFRRTLAKLATLADTNYDGGALRNASTGVARKCAWFGVYEQSATRLNLTETRAMFSDNSNACTMPSAQSSPDDATLLVSFPSSVEQWLRSSTAESRVMSVMKQPPLSKTDMAAADFSPLRIDARYGNPFALLHEQVSGGARYARQRVYGYERMHANRQMDEAEFLQRVQDQFLHSTVVLCNESLDDVHADGWTTWCALTQWAPMADERSVYASVGHCMSPLIVFEPGMKVLVSSVSPVCGPDERVLVVERLEFVTTDEQWHRRQRTQAQRSKCTTTTTKTTTDALPSNRELLSASYTRFDASAPRSADDFWFSGGDDDNNNRAGEHEENRSKSTTSNIECVDALESTLQKCAPIPYANWQDLTSTERCKHSVYDEHAAVRQESIADAHAKRCYSYPVRFVQKRQLDVLAAHRRRHVNTKRWTQTKLGYVLTGIDANGRRHTVQLADGSTRICPYECVPARDFVRHCASGVLCRPHDLAVLASIDNRNEQFDRTLFSALMLQCAEKMHIVKW